MRKIFALLSFCLFSLSWFSPLLAQAAVATESSDYKAISYTFNVPIGNLKECSISSSENNCLGLYLQAWYGFAVGIAGIFATVVIMYGGFKYLASRGDKGQAAKGKEYIIGATTGLALVFLSYTIISLVNPSLTVISMPSLPSFQSTSGVDLSDSTSGSHGSPTNTSTASKSSASSICNGVSGALNTSSDSTFPAKSINAAALDKVNNYSQAFAAAAATYGVSANMLKAIALAESGGNISAVSSMGACGLMQIMPSTANVSCSALTSNPVLSINLAAQYLKAEQDSGITNILDQIAGYNAGTSKTTGHALADSVDCPGVQAWECCTNAGGLSQTQDYVANVQGYYKTLEKSS